MPAKVPNVPGITGAKPKPKPQARNLIVFWFKPYLFRSKNIAFFQSVKFMQAIFFLLLCQTFSIYRFIKKYRTNVLCHKDRKVKQSHKSFAFIVITTIYRNILYPQGEASLCRPGKKILLCRNISYFIRYFSFFFPYLSFPRLLIFFINKYMQWLCGVEDL